MHGKLLGYCILRQLLSRARINTALGVLLASAFMLFAFSAFYPRTDKSKDHNRLAAVCPILSSEGSSAAEITSAIENASQEYKIDKQLLLAVMAAESRCLPSARSRAGALGLMQLMPGTASWLGVNEPLSIHENVKGGAKYLSLLLDEFDGSLVLALAAYNAGPSTVRRYRSIPPYRETRYYLKKVLGYYQLLSKDAETAEAV